MTAPSRYVAMAILLLTAVSSTALAATYHVAQQGGCSNHPDIATACGDSGACTASAPCCSIQAALNKATSPGDTVEIHSGTYEPGTLTQVCWGSACRDFLMAVKSCSSCNAESDRRYIRGACLKNDAYGDTSCGSNDNEDLPMIVDLSGTANRAPVVLGTAGSDNVNFITIEHLHFRGWSPGGNPEQFGIINANSNTSANYISIKRNRFDSVFPSGTANDSAVQNNYAAGWEANDFWLVKDNTITDWATTALNFFTANADWCASNGHVITGNHVTVSIGLSGRGWLRVKAFCGIVYNNYFTSTAPGIESQMYIRQGSEPGTFIFNNFFRTAEEVAFVQGGTGVNQELHFFNNTIESWVETSKGALAPIDPHMASRTARQFNNIFYGHTAQIFDCQNPAELGTIDYNVHTASSIVETPGSPCTYQLGQHNLRVSSKPYDAAGSLPAPYFKLSAGSAAIDVGSNDPLGQGPGNCVLRPQTLYGCNMANAEVCQEIDCSLDFEGDVRGAGNGLWDAGADEWDGAPGEEYGSVEAPPLPPRRGESSE